MTQAPGPAPWAELRATRGETTPIGYQSFNADTPVDVWYDAVAIDPNRIGCER